MAHINTHDEKKNDLKTIEVRNAINSWHLGPRSRISGISNQGATCYLNTLLQTLLHTPDLTSRLFEMAKKMQVSSIKRIVQELLVLFSQLLCGEGECVSAKPLTDSFGWNSNELLVHQDIQELNRLLFEQLEKSLRNTTEKNLISDLYRGVLRTRIHCLVCGRISERNDEFQDVNLSVTDWNSVQDSLKAHTQTEKLCEDNQYFCEQCKQRVDATKTSKFKELPPILTLSLSRFYFDANTMEACKLNKLCSFPLTLDMAEFVGDGYYQPVTYDLFSIVIHIGGTACGGHYHAYIKDPYGFAGQTQTKEKPTRVNSSELHDPKLAQIQTNTNSSTHRDSGANNLRNRRSLYPEQLTQRTDRKVVGHATRCTPNKPIFRKPPQELIEQCSTDLQKSHISIHRWTSEQDWLKRHGVVSSFMTERKAAASGSSRSVKATHIPGVMTTPAVAANSADKLLKHDKKMLSGNSGTKTSGYRQRSESVAPCLYKSQQNNLVCRMKGIFLPSKLQTPIPPSIDKLGSIRSSQHQCYPANPSTTPTQNKKLDCNSSLSTGHENKLTQCQTSSNSTLVLDQYNDDVTEVCDTDVDSIARIDMSQNRTLINSHNNDDGRHQLKRTTSSISSKISGRSSSVSTWKSRLFAQGQSDDQFVKPSLDTLGSMDPQIEDEYPTPILSSKDVQIKNSMDLAASSEQRKASRKQAAVSSEEDEPKTISIKHPPERLKLQKSPKALHAGKDEMPTIGRWFDFNDDVITEVDPANFNNVFEGHECAYMLFYKHIRV